MIAVLLRQADGKAQGPAPGNDGDLMDRIVGGQVIHGYGVTGLMNGGDLPVCLPQDPALFLRPGNDLQNGFVKVLLIQGGTVGPGSQNCGLVDYVGKVRPRKAGGGQGHGPEADGAVQTAALCMDF